MDNSAKEIVFTDTGCNFCDHARAENKKVLNHNQFHQEELTNHIDKSVKYDCLVGLSGGVDSSYALARIVALGFRPLCFSIDTGYNKPDADENIMKLVEGLKVPFFRYTIDLQKFKKLQAAFMQAGVKNIEIPTDHVLMAASYEMAAKYGIKTILSGGNVATESIMPPSWGYNARDLTHVKAIYKRFTGKNLSGLPLCSVWKWNYYRWIKKIKIIYPLDYLVYNRTLAERYLTERFGYKSTGDKHEENYFTWWFQNFYLFRKFGIDKRKPHYSSMIVSGQMTRQEALDRLTASPIYPELGIEERVLKYPKHEHEEYPMDPWYDRIAWIVKKLQWR